MSLNAFKRFGICLAVSSLALATLVSCSTSGETDVKEGTGVATNPPQPKKNVEIKLFGNSTASEIFFSHMYGDALRKRFPDYTFTYIQREKQTMQEMVASGVKFDIYYNVNGTFEPDMFDLALEVDMTDLINKHKLDVSRIDPAVIDPIKQHWGGKMYGIPLVTNTFVLFYNKDLFDKFGVAYPKNGMTWDETIELSKKLNRNEGGVQYIGLSTSPPQMIRQNQFTIPIVDTKTERPTIHTEERWKLFYDTVFVKPLQDPSVRDYVQKKKAIPALAEFAQDRTLSMFSYNNHFIYVDPWTERMQAFNWDMVTQPLFPAAPNMGTQPLATIFGITKFASNVEESMEVLNYMMSDEYQKFVSGRGFLGVLKNKDVLKGFGLDTPFKDKNYSAVLSTKFSPITESNAYVSTVLNSYSSAALKAASGEKDLNSAFREAEELSLKAIEAIKERQK